MSLVKNSAASLVSVLVRKLFLMSKLKLSLLRVKLFLLFLPLWTQRTTDCCLNNLLATGRLLCLCALVFSYFFFLFFSLGWMNQVHLTFPCQFFFLKPWRFYFFSSGLPSAFSSHSASAVKWLCGCFKRGNCLLRRLGKLRNSLLWDTVDAKD